MDVKTMDKITTQEMEVALAKYLNFRTNVVVPNVSWGMFSHECDLIRLTPAGYCSEVEIKVSLSDLKKDAQKHHNHVDGNGYRTNKIKYLYFAIPEYLEQYTNYIPERAGILVVKEIMKDWWDSPRLRVYETRKPKQACNYKFTEAERHKLLHLMAMRIWNLKKKLAKL
jgi:hypothetical protein